MHDHVMCRCKRADLDPSSVIPLAHRISWLQYVRTHTVHIHTDTYIDLRSTYTVRYMTKQPSIIIIMAGARVSAMEQFFPLKTSEKFVSYYMYVVLVN